MIDVNKLRGRIAECGLSQTDVAKKLNISPNTFFRKMKKGVFGSKEIQKMLDVLDIDDPKTYFFVKK